VFLGFILIASGEIGGTFDVTAALMSLQNIRPSSS